LHQHKQELRKVKPAKKKSNGWGKPTLHSLREQNQQSLKLPAHNLKLEIGTLNDPEGK
jgi:hypothetical protein